jgi:hypothetical protein
MTKRRGGSRIPGSLGSLPVLTPDHEKSGIDPKYLAAENVRHTVGKVSMRATTLLETALRSEVCSQSYGTSKSRESCRGGISGLPRGSPGKKSHLDVVSAERRREYYKGGRWWLPPSPGRGESCVSVLPVVGPSTKGAPTLH